jgi:LCP family protein required for cell wall assembly
MLHNLPYKKIFLAIFLVLLVLLGFWYYHNVRARNLVTGVISDPAENLTTLDRRVNVVLLGIGGDGHEGSDLTDSIMFISLNVDNQKALLVPLPRDIWVDSLKAKINTAYHYGKERRENGGRDLVKSAVAEVVGQPVHYVLVLDFAGFEKVIDAIGGIDVKVERTFDDYKYPIPGKEDAEPESERYTHVHFDAGQTHMNGATALQFTRSRHAEGDEGTDFARSARQEKVLLAFRDKVLSTQTLLNNNTMTTLLNSVAASIDTDITEREYGSFGKLALAMDRQAGLNNISLESHLQNPKNRAPYLGQYVLIPKESWQELHEYVKANLPN